MSNIFTRIWNNHEKIAYGLSKAGLLNWMSDKLYLKFVYRLTFGKKLNLNNPQTFNEKLQYLKLYDRKDIYTKLVDKYEVKEYVSRIIGDKYIIPTLGIYNNFDEIDFNSLPNEFVIKTTHNSGDIIIVKDKTKIIKEELRKKINKSLNNNLYLRGREWPYKNVKPRIIIEKYMIDKQYNELRDYKFFCFNNNINFFKIDYNRTTNHRANYYDMNGTLLEFGEIICPPDFYKKIDMPQNINLMKELAKKLSNNIDFVRVDFYEVDGKVYFGEMTFFPNSGFGRFSPELFDKKIGDMLKISCKKEKN